MPSDIANRLRAIDAFPLLRGGRVTLRGPTDADADDLFAVFSDREVMRYWSREAMTEASEAAALVVEIEERFADRAMLQWMIADARDDRAIGTCTLFHVDPPHRRAEIGYALRRDRWGAGLATEAVSLALDWAFDVLGLHRVEADIDPRNAASRAMLARLGFQVEGLLRERFFVGDAAGDSELLGLLAPEWRARRAAAAQR